jgi:hypothetical protein
VKKPLTLILASVLFHWPRFAFFVEASQRLKGQAPWELMCNKWDCGWFIAQSNALRPEAAAFYPLYPLVLRAFRSAVPVLSPQMATVVLSNLFSVLCCCLLVLLGERLWSGGRRYFGFGLRSWALGFLVTVFPFSQFFSLGYSEPLFLSLFSAMLLLVFADRWELAAIPAGLCAVTRPPGVWVMGTFVAVYLWAHREVWRRRGKLAKHWPRAASILIVSGLPLLMYRIWNWDAAGDPLHFIRVEGKWDRHFNLLAGLRCHLPQYELNHVFLYASLYGGWKLIHREAPVWKILAVTTLFAAEVPLFVGGFGYSYSRLMAGNLGLFAGITEVVTLTPWLWTGWLAWSFLRLSVEANNWFGDYYKIGP